MITLHTSITRICAILFIFRYIDSQKKKKNTLGVVMCNNKHVCLEKKWTIASTDIIINVQAILGFECQRSELRLQAALF